MKNLNGNQFPQRKQIRLLGYDYSQCGYYFVTICTENRKCLFGHIVGVGRDRPVAIGRDRPEMIGRDGIILNNYGEIIDNVLESLPNHHSVKLDEYQIMPNHIHFILQINDAGASRRAPTLGLVVGLFKSETTKQIRNLLKNPNIIIWQRNYYEHIIRNEIELNKIREYIKSNPQMWERDRNNPEKHFGLQTISVDNLAANN